MNTVPQPPERPTPVLRVAKPPPTGEPLAVLLPNVAWLSTPIADSTWKNPLRPPISGCVPRNPMFDELDVTRDLPGTSTPVGVAPSWFAGCAPAGEAPVAATASRSTLNVPYSSTLPLSANECNGEDKATTDATAHAFLISTPLVMVNAYLPL